MGGRKKNKGTGKIEGQGEMREGKDGSRDTIKKKGGKRAIMKLGIGREDRKTKVKEG